MSHTQTNRRKLQSGRCSRLLTAFVLLGCCGVFLTVGKAQANDTNTIVLQIHGNMQTSNTTVGLKLADLMAMEATTFTTSSPWTEHPTRYTGVRISTLLQKLGAQSQTIEARASNDYKFTLTGIDFATFPIIIAYKKNDELIDVRSLGPLLIMFPFDDFPELLTEKNKAASVWQLTELEIH